MSTRPSAAAAAAQVRAVQHENALILNQLQEKGIEFKLDDDTAVFRRSEVEAGAGGRGPSPSPEAGATHDGASASKHRRHHKKRSHSPGKDEQEGTTSADPDDGVEPELSA